MPPAIPPSTSILFSCGLPSWMGSRLNYRPASMSRQPSPGRFFLLVRLIPRGDDPADFGGPPAADTRGNKCLGPVVRPIGGAVSLTGGGHPRLADKPASSGLRSAAILLVLVVEKPAQHTRTASNGRAGRRRTRRPADKGAATGADGAAAQHPLLGSGHAGAASTKQGYYHQQDNHLFHLVLS